MAETTESSPTVLVVEDDQAISGLIRRVLTGDLNPGLSSRRRADPRR